jgi:hypothetical protein
MKFKLKGTRRKGEFFPQVAGNKGIWLDIQILWKCRGEQDEDHQVEKRHTVRNKVKEVM